MTEELTASSGLPLEGYPQNRLQQMMDYYAFIRWQEAKVRRNPMVAIKRLIDLEPDFNAYPLDA